MLDQRIARERAEDVNAGHRRLEGRRQLWKGLAVGAAKLDPHRLDKSARRHRAEARDNHVARDPLVAVRRFERHPAVLDQPGLGFGADINRAILARVHQVRSDEHTSELQSLMRISYAVFCLKKQSTIIQQIYQSFTDY